MKHYPKITIVTPSYNQGEFLEDTIISIITQGYPNLEYFVCDGGSTDNSVEIIKKYEDKIAWWCSERDNGQTDAINKGMKKATGDIVGWINSDDVMLQKSLFVIADFFENNKKCEFANGAICEIDRVGNVIRFKHLIMSKFFMKHGSYSLCQQGMFWKRYLFEKIGYLDETFHAKMDVEWLIRNYEADTAVMLVDKPLGAIRVYDETKTAKGGDIWKNDAEKIHKRYNGMYVPRKYSIFRILFYMWKLLRGCYLKNRIWRNRYKQKNYKEIIIIE